MDKKLSVFSAMVVQHSFETYFLAASTAKGAPIHIEWNPTSIIAERLDAGENADVIIVSDEAMISLVEKGLILKDTVRPLVNSSIGFATLPGKEEPDFSTTENMILALLNYSRIAYSVRGLSGMLFSELMTKLAILDEIEKRAVMVEGGLTAEKLLTNEADVAIQQISELQAVKGVKVIGKLPDELNCRLSFSVGIVTNTTLESESQDFISLLTELSTRQYYTQSGLEPRF